MKKVVFLLASLVLISCGKDKEVLLPMASETVVADVTDHSPIYMFFKLEEKDTIVEVNRKNSISSTNWLFNIDKRLPLRKVILEVKKLQTKKDGSVHKSETSENYFTYTDTVKKTMAFYPFTKMKFRLEKPDFNVTYFYLDRNDLVHYNELVFSKSQIYEFMEKLPAATNLYFGYDKGMSFGKYIRWTFFVKNLKETEKKINIKPNLVYIY